MSSLPPGAPPPAPPATPPPPSQNPLPWEDRDRRGFLQALTDTMGLFISRPSEAWARARESGDMTSPLLFGLIVGWVSAVAQSVIARIAPVPVMLPGRWGRSFERMHEYRGGGIAVTAIVAPIAILIALFIGAAILHVCCMLVGALNASTSGFEGTFRASAYAHVASLANVVPGIGPLVFCVWWIFLAVMGLQRMHKTTQGKALAAIFIPIVLCCGVVLLVLMVAGAAILSRMSH
ncbi:MAG TPA: YIP1 family protein [Thermoanaerobaculia bacterium]|nr:YIP1 family protein [Thermoanaerobaculia bacterium]